MINNKNKILAISFASSLSLSSFANEPKLDFNWVDSKGVLSQPTNENMLVTQSAPSEEIRKFILNWSKGTIKTNYVFKVALQDQSKWLVNHWLKHEKNNNKELYSMYLILKTDELISNIKGGNTNSFFDLVRLSIDTMKDKNPYVNSKLQEIKNSDDITVAKAMALATKVRDSIEIIDNYNSGSLSWEELYIKAESNTVLFDFLIKDTRFVDTFLSNNSKKLEELTGVKRDENNIPIIKDVVVEKTNNSVFDIISDSVISQGESNWDFPEISFPDIFTREINNKQNNSDIKFQSSSFNWNNSEDTSTGVNNNDLAEEEIEEKDPEKSFWNGVKERVMQSISVIF